MKRCTACTVHTWWQYLSTGQTPDTLWQHGTLILSGLSLIWLVVGWLVVWQRHMKRSVLETARAGSSGKTHRLLFHSHPVWQLQTKKTPKKVYYYSRFKISALFNAPVYCKTPTPQATESIVLSSQQHTTSFNMLSWEYCHLRSKYTFKHYITYSYMHT